ncbi:bZIP transcription factor 53-like [Curcuma longa]|uniref:bZIP transcription factor 53-like n=1 Tax=Curcuma longa TaxID=136217 RepID=UPI003D9E2686
MSSLPARRASSSEGEPHPAIDERKRKRMLSNRESAKRSRMRKQKRLDELVSEEAKIKTQNAQLSTQIHAVTTRYAKVESENAILRAQLNELTQRLQSVNSVLRFVEEFSGMAMDIPEMPFHPILKPWQLPCPAQPIMANAEMLQF